MKAFLLSGNGDLIFSIMAILVIVVYLVNRLRNKRKHKR